MLLQELRVVLAEQLAELLPAPLRHRVYRLNQLIDLRRHNQQVPAPAFPRIPVRV